MVGEDTWVSSLKILLIITKHKFVSVCFQQGNKRKRKEMINSLEKFNRKNTEHVCVCGIVTGGLCSSSSQDGGRPLLRWWRTFSLTWGSWPQGFQGMVPWGLW